MAGVVHVPWYATGLRGDRLEAALAEIAPVALRYGASSYQVLRNRDDRYKFVQTAVFENKMDFDRYWAGPEMTHFRIATQSYFQVPIVYTWNDVVVEGYLEGERERAGLRTEPGAVGDTV